MINNHQCNYRISVTRLILFLLVFLTSNLSAQELEANLSEIQELVKKQLNRTMSASVYLADYDTVSKKNLGPRFSGVVVNKTGLILTAGHASRPGKTYMVKFANDTKQYIAVGCGRIALFDAAMIQIQSDSKEFPYVEMGSSSTLKPNTLCFSIAYPGSFTPERQVIRLGNIVEVINNRRSMLRTTCLMEPGDSGGPVFDMQGQVIGIRSNILNNLDQNFDVPVDVFRKYWSALQKKEDYQFLPQSDEILSSKTVVYKTTNPINNLLTKEQTSLDKYCIPLYNSKDSVLVLGTLVDIGDLKDRRTKSNKAYIVSKSSLVPDTIFARRSEKLINAKVLFRDKIADLVLLELPEKVKAAIKILVIQDTLTVGNMGNLLISPVSNSKFKIGILGAVGFDLPPFYSSGFMGVSFADSKDKNIISVIQPNSPASKSELKVGDEVIAINGIEINSPTLFTKEVQTHLPGENLVLTCFREGRDTLINVRLGRRRLPPLNSIADRYIGGRSDRFDGFNTVFVHDSKLVPSEAGSPIFDLNGAFWGINMARYSRTSNVAVQRNVIADFIRRAISERKMIDK